MDYNDMPIKPPPKNDVVTKLDVIEKPAKVIEKGETEKTDAKRTPPKKKPKIDISGTKPIRFKQP